VSIVVIVWKMPLLNHHVKAAAVSKDFGGDIVTMPGYANTYH